MSETSPYTKPASLNSEGTFTYLPTNNDATGHGNIEHYESSEAAYAAGKEYAKNFLVEPLHIFESEVTKKQEEGGLKDDEIGFVFLDRDGRPVLHAWQAMTKGKYRAMPLPVGNAQFDGLSMGFMYATFEQWSSEMSKKEFEDNTDRHFLSYFPTEEKLQSMQRNMTVDSWLKYKERIDKAQIWKDLVVKQTNKIMKDKKLVYLVDIGMLGSAVELSRFLLADANKNVQYEPYMLYGDGTNAPHALKIVTNHIEDIIPHATKGYYYNETKYSYERDKEETPIEHAFMRGVKDAAGDDTTNTV